MTNLDKKTSAFRCMCVRIFIWPLFFMVLILLFSNTLPAADRFLVMCSLQRIFPSDAVYREIYGAEIFTPELEIGHYIYGNYYIWLHYNVVRKSGLTLPSLQAEAICWQHFAALGIGFREHLTSRLGYKLEAGVGYLIFHERVLELQNNGAGFGFCGTAGFTWDLSPHLWLEFMGSVQRAAASGADWQVRLGGFSVGMGIGMRI